MRRNDIFKMCLQNLKRRKSRTLLTLLGVVIGCCSIIIMVSIGLGSAEAQNKMLAQMGDLTIITVNSNQTGQEQDALNDDALSKFKSLEHVVTATPKVYMDEFECSVTLYAGTNDRYVASWSTVVGVDVQALDKMGYKLISGTSAQQSGEVLVGQYLAYNFYDSLRPDGNNMIYYWEGGFDDNGNPLNPPDPYFDPLTTPMVMEVQSHDKKVRIPITPTGIMKEDYVKGYETSSGLVMSIAGIRDILREIQPTEKKELNYNTVLVKVSDITKVAETEKAIREYGFSTYSMESIREPMEKEARQKQLMLAGLGAISLFVAALGITNTMIMSISERTREIGIMKSLGCYVKDIRVLFLTEAGTIGLLGGILGSFISMVAAIIINMASFGSPPSFELFIASIIGSEAVTRVCVVPLWLLLASIVFSVIIGLASGYYPANKAVRISALEAIKAN